MSTQVSSKMSRSYLYYGVILSINALSIYSSRATSSDLNIGSKNIVVSSNDNKENRRLGQQDTTNRGASVKSIKDANDNNIGKSERGAEEGLEQLTQILEQTRQLTKQVDGLQQAADSLKYQNHLIYKQLKKMSKLRIHAENIDSVPIKGRS